jgi:hypothetical protein
MPVRAVVYDQPPTEIDPQHEVRLAVEMLRQKPYVLRLDWLRPDELAVLKEVFDDAFKYAEVVCKEQYLANRAAYEAGDPPHLSFYREWNLKAHRYGDDPFDGVELPDYADIPPEQQDDE